MTSANSTPSRQGRYHTPNMMAAVKLTCCIVLTVLAVMSTQTEVTNRQELLNEMSNQAYDRTTTSFTTKVEKQTLAYTSMDARTYKQQRVTQMDSLAATDEQEPETEAALSDMIVTGTRTSEPPSRAAMQNGLDKSNSDTTKADLEASPQRRGGTSSNTEWRRAPDAPKDGEGPVEQDRHSKHSGPFDELGQAVESEDRQMLESKLINGEWCSKGNSFRTDAEYPLAPLSRKAQP